MRAEREPVLDLCDENLEGPKISPDNTSLLLNGQLLAKTGVFPKGEIIPFRRTKLTEDVLAANKKNEPLKDLFMHLIRIGALVVFVTTSSEIARIGASAIDNANAWQNANTLPSESGLKFGGSFSLEQYGLTLENYKTAWGKEQYAKAMADLKDLHENEKINDFRIEFQWKDVVDANGKFDPGLNKQMLNYLFSQPDINLTINLGIKTFRWPEQNVKGPYLNEVNAISKRDAIVHSTDTLADESIQYESEVLNDLQNTYSKDKLSQVKVIQFNNECKNRFGDDAVEIDDATNIKSVDNVINNFPEFAKAEFLFNSAGFFDIEGIDNLLQQLREKYPQIKLGMGIDYYGSDVGSVKLLFVGDANPEKLPGLDRVDPLFYDNFLGKDFQKAKDDASKVNYKEVVTELEAEPWDGNAKLPGNIVLDFNYATERAIDILPSKNQTKAQDDVEVDVWGLEYLMKNKYDPQVKQILQEIKETNSK